MKINRIKGISILFLLLLISSLSVGAQDSKKIYRMVTGRLKRWENPLQQWQYIAKPKFDSLIIQRSPDKLDLYFAPGLSYYPFREESVILFMKSVRKSLGRKFRKYDIEIITNRYNLNQLVPNYFRKLTAIDNSRFPLIYPKKPVLVRKVSATVPVKGLSGNSVALWHSHGYYFEMNLDRWEWQRARLFGTVEDISTLGYVVPYLTKMLENSGAMVYLPRERDTQLNEVIVDNDKSTGQSELVIHKGDDVQKIAEGFLLTDTLFQGYNPFKHGTALRIKNDSAQYIPDIPEKGEYAVYVSYPLRPDNSESVIYTVFHTGGQTSYLVNQTIGGETWIYLGTFQFDKGKNQNYGSVSVKGSEKDKYISLDAIRFGGGMGNVARRPSPQIIKNLLSVNENKPGKLLTENNIAPSFSWKVSGKPRFLEAARYYLQYAGMPDTLVYSPNANKNDYNDDYQSRGYWVNYLMSKPKSEGDTSKLTGLGLPVDLSFAFHTDAGVTPNDSVIGTLAIYSTDAGNGKFPDGTSRLASRDISDIIQTEVVTDIRNKFDRDWTRRGLWDKPYSEARRPDVPATLLELLSHQNLADQRFGLDPRFRFQVCRSIYKGILKYLAYAERREYVVQPLPVKSFAVVPVSGKKIRLSWEPQSEMDEPTSAPDKYMIYTRTGDNGFDNGFAVDKPMEEIELASYDTIYSFKVTAINAGGESFDSEILSAGISSQDKNMVLVVNGFKRISGPAWFDKKDMAGIAWWRDRGVADHNDIITVGDQYDFNRKSDWLDDDSPGWGASYDDMAGKIIPGNSFDYPYTHGRAIIASGHSFYSMSGEYFCSDRFSATGCKNVDLIFGEEKSTPSFKDTAQVDFKIYTPEFMKRISELTKSGANIFMSGAYVGSDLKVTRDSAEIKFAASTLHFLPRTGHAVKTGNVYPTDYMKPFFEGNIDFNTDYSRSIYTVEAPDAIEPSGKGAFCTFRYSENNASAGVSFRSDYKTVILGFPFETIKSESQRNQLMREILNYFEK